MIDPSVEEKKCQHQRYIIILFESGFFNFPLNCARLMLTHIVSVSMWTHFGAQLIANIRCCCCCWYFLRMISCSNIIRWLDVLNLFFMWVASTWQFSIGEKIKDQAIFMGNKNLWKPSGRKKLAENEFWINEIKNDVCEEERESSPETKISLKKEREGEGAKKNITAKVPNTKNSREKYPKNKKCRKNAAFIQKQRHTACAS